MAERQPPAGEDEPEDVAKHREGLVASGWHQRPAERPERVAGQLERLHPERDADDGDAHEDARDHVSDPHPDAREDQPDDVEDEPHAFQRTPSS